MNVRTYAIITSVIFALVAILHLVRIIGQWDVIVAGWIVPMWVSVLGCVMAAGLAMMLWREMRK